MSAQHRMQPTPLRWRFAARLKHTFIVFLSFWAVCCASALADENTDKKITESALRETWDVISRELFGHYDLTNLAVLKIEDLQGRESLGHDYGLVISPLFLAAFLGTAAACVLAIISSLLRGHDPGAIYRLVGGALYLVGTFLVTIVFNVPKYSVS